MADFWVKVGLSIVTIAVIGPLDVAGVANAPLTPEVTLLALGAIWGIEAIEEAVD